MSAEAEVYDSGGVASAVTKTAPMPRVYFLDNLNVLLACLVVLDHAAQPYLPASGWVIPSGGPESSLDVFVITTFLILISSFFMGLFFMISAYFLPSSLERKGAARFMKDRLVKLGVPILVFMFGVFPAVGYLLYYYGLYNQGQPLITFGNLWFLAVLLIFTTVYVAYWLVKKPSSQNKPFPNTRSILAFVIVLALVSFVVGIWAPINYWVPLGLFEPFHLTKYAMLFAAGIAAYRERWIDAIPKTAARLWTGIAFFTILFLVVVSALNSDALLLGGAEPGSILGSFWQAFFCVSTCIALLVFFKDRLNSQGPLAKALADNSYTVFIIQLPIIIFLQYLLMRVPIDPFIKFVIVGVTGIPLIFAISHYGVRRFPYAKYILG